MSGFRDRWYTADFDQLDWHDVHVHGFRIVEGAHGCAELQLDIDFILARSLGDDAGAGRAAFRVAQAMLQFHEVSGLRFSLDYVACSAGMSAFSIGTIARWPLHAGADGIVDADGPADEPEFADRGPWRWRIEVNWPEGALEFEASGFSQWLVGEPIEQDMPSLVAADRL